MICPSGRRDNESLIFLRLTEVIGAALLGWRGREQLRALGAEGWHYFPGFGVQLVIRVIGGGLPAGGEFTTNHFPSGAAS